MQHRQYSYADVVSHPHSHSKVVHCLRVVWILLFLWFEVGFWHWSLHDCKWPDNIWMEPNAAARTREQARNVLSNLSSNNLIPHRLRTHQIHPIFCFSRTSTFSIAVRRRAYHRGSDLPLEPSRLTPCREVSRFSARNFIQTALFSLGT